MTTSHGAYPDPLLQVEDELFDPLVFLKEVENKRKQNRLAAQRSRQRKKDYVQQLEERVGELNKQLARWKATVEIYDGMMRAHGIFESRVFLCHSASLLNRMITVEMDTVYLSTPETAPSSAHHQTRSGVMHIA
ncbi:hypothetical protein BDZ89DRAFT_440304 [Hymenopellis radicata]|nr:hypothetical protein BDZ89DRAFT_440304 [Hymenopellis radicata]